MELDKINSFLLNKIIEDEHLAIKDLLHYRPTIEYLTNNKLRLNSKIELPQNHKSSEFIENVCISTLFSDLITIYPYPNFFGYSRVEKDKVDQAGIKEFLIKDKDWDNFLNSYIITEVFTGNATFSDDQAAFLKESLLPLFNSGRITLSLNNFLIVHFERDNDKRMITIPSEFDEINQAWKVLGIGMDQKEILVQPSNEIYNNDLLNSIFIPYIKGISIEDFAKIIDDEEDLLSSLRKEMKSLTTSAYKNNQYILEIYQDEVRPRIDKLNQKFNSVANIHKLKVRGAVVATASLSLVSLLVGDIIGATSTLLSVASGSAGLVKFESEYQNELNNLKADPFYLLWKLRHIKSTRT